MNCTLLKCSLFNLTITDAYIAYEQEFISQLCIAVTLLKYQWLTTVNVSHIGIAIKLYLIVHYEMCMTSANQGT